MTKPPRPATTDLTGLTWRKSSFSGDTGGNCVEIATVGADYVAVRDSSRPQAGAVLLTHAEARAWISSVKDGSL